MKLLGFLSDKSGEFMLELWKLLLEAQEKDNGIVRFYSVNLFQA